MSAPLHFLPLGGAGEIGMNLNLYECGGAWLICDLGVTFAGEELPGIDLIMPDTAYIERLKSRIRGLVLTHAHEDHVGAVPFLWPRLKCPVYATPFTAAFLRRKVQEGADGIEDIEITEVPLGGEIDLDPFTVKLVSLTHSIPEPNALVIETLHGSVVHTGDWKLDPDPLISAPADEDMLKRMGDSGILSVVCDSTNAFRPGVSGSEAEVRKSLVDLVATKSGRVGIATFASNLARLLSVYEAARVNGRECVVAGRSLHRILDCARETGYLPKDVRFVSDREAARLTPEKTLVVMTGCQGEPRAALSRIADGSHRTLSFDDGDCVIFSSKIIPGNERPIYDLINRLLKRNVEVITEKDHFVHVSGHPNRDELVRMYKLLRPKTAIPVHGETRHMREHAELARQIKVPNVVQVENGTMARLAPGKPGIVDHVPHGRLIWNGRRVLPVNSEIIRERRSMMASGIVLVSIFLDRRGELQTDPAISLVGLDEKIDPEIVDDMVDDVVDGIEGLRRDQRLNDDEVRRIAHKRVRYVLKLEFTQRPLVEIQIVRA